MELLGVHHVSINVDDVPAAVAFYKALGMTERTDRPTIRGVEGAWLDAGAQQLHLIASPVPENKGQHFALRVADLAATVDELRAKGIAISDAQPIGTGHQAFVVDPCGNLVELHQSA